MTRMVWVMMNHTIVFLVCALAPMVAGILAGIVAMILGILISRKAESSYVPEVRDAGWIDAIEAECMVADIDAAWDECAAFAEMDRAMRAFRFEDARTAFLASAREGIRAAAARIRSRMPMVYAGEEADLVVYLSRHSGEANTVSHPYLATARKLTSEFAMWTDREVRDVMGAPFYFDTSEVAHLCTLESLAHLGNVRGDTEEATRAFRAAVDGCTFPETETAAFAA